MRTRRSWPILCLILLFLAVPCRAADAPAPVYVILWFDTEDYILPASDDAALKIADFLTHENIRATFKVVGEKARTLERRQRTDVVEALKKHEIGYHANYHSVQPSPAMYLSTLGWDEGVAEFDRRERPGFDDVKRIFGKAPTCYGQPGSSWGPQSYGAMQKWGMEVYLDSGNHVRLDDKPYYYCGILNLYRLAYVLRTNLGGPNDLEQAEGKFIDARKKIQAEGGGIVSIYYHPCEFVHKEFWDGVNFRNGANPPREEWKQPPMKTPEESRVAYQTFEQYVRFLKRFPEVHFITASEAGRIWRDSARERKFTVAELKAIAAAVKPEVTFQRREDYTLAPSEIFVLLNAFVAETAAGRGPAAIAFPGTPYGPSGPAAPLAEAVTTDMNQFARTAADVADYIKRHGRVPTTVWLGSTPVPPESYLDALARVTVLITAGLADGRRTPDLIEIRPARLAASTYVADDDPKKLWGWVIFPRGFRAPAMMELAKRQAWTLKPAILHNQPEAHP